MALRIVTCFSLFLFFLGGCRAEKSYDIDSDPMIADLNLRITALEEDLSKLKGEIEAVDKIMKAPEEFETELKQSLRKEQLEGQRYVSEIEQWIAYLKVQRKQRYLSLHRRKDSAKLADEAEQEVKAYMVEKELKPIQRSWENRYRTAIEL